MPAPTFERRQILQAVAAAGATLAFPGVLRAQTDRSTLVLGQSAPFSGPAASLGERMHQGAWLYFEQLNAAGGVQGRRIELRRLDDGYEPERCKANTEQFIRDDVFALFGYVGTPTSLAALPLAVEANLPFFAPFTGAQALREPFRRNVFHVRASYIDETARIVAQLTSTGVRKIAVFHQNDSYGAAGLDGVTRALKTQGLAPVAVGTVERNSTDVAAAVRAIVPAAPEAVVQISAYKSCAAFIREARKAGYGSNFYNVSFVGTQALLNELGRDARGVIVSQVMPYPYSGISAIAREYLEALKRAGGEMQPDYTSMEGYVAARVFAEGLRRAPKLTREGLIAGLESIGELSLGGFTVGFSPSNHVGSRFVELSMLGEDGRVRR